MKTQAWTFLTALTLLAGISVNAQSQDQSGRVKIADSRVVQTQGGTPHVIGQPLENSGSAQLIPQESFSPNNYSAGSAMVSGGAGYPPIMNYQQDSYNQPSKLPPGVMTHPQTDDPFQIQFGVDQRVGGLQGYDGSYTGLRMFAPFATSDGSLWFIEPRLNITDDGSPGANVGIGHRMYSPFYDAVQSFSGWWDYDDGHNFNYQQFGLSYSYLTRYWRFRANGYQVTSENNRLLSSQSIGDLYYQSNFILRDRLSQIETAYNGVDAELGGPIPVLGVYGLNWAAGAYYLEGIGDEDAVGVKGRVEAQINEDWQFNVSISEDKLFGTNVQLGVQVNLADAMPARWFRQYDMYKYLALPEERNYRVNTRVSSQISQDQLINPADGNPFCIAHIIPDAVGPAVPAGDGTFENPFNSLDAYRDAGLNPTPEACDIILVRGSDALGTNLQHGITIFERQRLLAASSTHQITGLINGVSGTFNLPDTGTGVTPVLFNTFDPPGVNTSVVTIDPTLTIAQDSLTEVSGFQIDGTPGGLGSPLIIGINGVGALDGGLNANRNNFIDTRIGINFVNNANAETIINSNTFTGAGNSSLFGINITQTAGSTLDLLINNNTITGYSGEDVNNNGILDVGEDTGIPDGSLAANGTLEDGIGINLIAIGAGTEINADDSFNTIDTLGITNNTVTGNGSGVRVVALSGADQNLDFLNNNISNNTTPVGIDATGAGLLLQADAASSIINVNRFRNNTVDNNAGHGALLSVTNTAAINFLDPDADNEAFDGNSFDNNGFNGMFISANNGTILFDHLGSDFNPTTSNSFNGNGANGLQANILNAGSLTITDPVNNVTFNNNGDNGLLVNIDGAGSVLSAQFGDLIPGGVGNQFIGNGATSGTGDGFNLTAVNDPTITLSLFNNQFNENNGDGIEFNLTNMLATPLDGLIISDNQFLDNINGHGMNFVADAAEISNLTISDNTAGGPPGGSSGNGLSGLFFDLSNGSTLNLATIDGNNFEANDQHGIHYQVNNSSVLGNLITGNFITAQVNGHGIFIDDITNPLIAIDPLEFAISDNQIIDNGGAGILGNINSGDITALISGNTITGNVDEGIGFTLLNNSNFFSNEFDNNIISENGSYGLRLSGVDTANIELATAGTGGPNVLDANVDAGILLELADNTTGRLLIENTTVTNTSNGINPLDAGEGVHIRLTDNSIVSDASFSNSTSSSNTGAGYRVDAFANTELTNLTIDTSTFDENGANGLALRREGNSFIGRNTSGGAVTLIDSSFTNNTGDGINVSAIGAPVANVNDVTINVTGTGLTITDNTDDGVDVNLDILSSANVSLASSNVSNNIAGNGIEVTTNTQSVFRNVGGATAPVIFDGLLVNGNGANGYQFTINDQSQQFVDILGDVQQATISNNTLNGILYTNNSVNASTIHVGNGSTTPATPGTDAVPDVVIAGNLVDGMNVSNTSSGLVTYTVNNVELTGNRTVAAASDDGIDLSVTGSTLFGAPSMIFTVLNTSITNFDDDGYVLTHNSAAVGGSTGTLLNITNSVLGADDFNFNGGDGLQLGVFDNGAVINVTGSLVNRNTGDGVRFTSTAEGRIADGNLAGQVVNVPDPANGANNNWNGVGNILFLRPDYFGSVPPGAGDVAGTPPRLVYEIGGPINTAGTLSIASTDMNFNGGNGLELNVGTSSQQVVSLQASNLFGNGAPDLFTQSFASFQLTNASVNAGDGGIDTVVMDNAGLLTLNFGDTTPNNGNRITTFGTGSGTHTNADGFKGNSRPTLLEYAVTVPGPLNANPNNFVDLGGPVDESLSFPNRGSTNFFLTSPDNNTILP